MFFKKTKHTKGHSINSDFTTIPHVSKASNSRFQLFLHSIFSAKHHAI